MHPISSRNIMVQQMHRVYSDFFRLGFRLQYLLIAAAVLTGCDTQPTDLAQSVAEVTWRPNESGMLALVDQTTQSAIDLSTTTTYSLYNVGADGGIGQPVNAPQQAGNGYPPILYLSKDGNTAITQLGTDIYRIDLPGNIATDIIQNTNLLMVSPDFKYLLSTENSTGYPSKLCTIYDISVNPIRRVQQFTAVGVTNGRGLWLENGLFALTHNDTIGFHVNVYDTTGTTVSQIPNAEAAFHASAFSPLSHDLFVRTNNEGIDKINLQTGVRTSVITQDSVGSMDASANGALIVYSSNSFARSFNLYEVNVADTSKKAEIGQNAIAVVIAPNADRAAVIHYVDTYNSDINTVSVSVP
jgi:hypothetical protein